MTTLQALLDAIAAYATCHVAPQGLDVEVAGGSLFDMANFVADLIEAPVTLEDVHGRVVAFSKQVGEIDAMRTATILLGQMPAERMEWLRQRGVFRQVLRSGRPTYVEPD